MEPRHLLYSAVTCSLSGNVRHLKWRHRFVPNTRLISSYDNKSAALWTDHQWNCGVVGEHYKSSVLWCPTLASILLEWPCHRSSITASAPVLDVSAPAYSNGVWAPSVACAAQNTTVDHVVLCCPIHGPPHGVHGLTVLDNKTIKWLLNKFAAGVWYICTLNPA